MLYYLSHELQTKETKEVNLNQAESKMSGMYLPRKKEAKIWLIVASVVIGISVVGTFANNKEIHKDKYKKVVETVREYPELKVKLREFMVDGKLSSPEYRTLTSGRNVNWKNLVTDMLVTK